MVPVVILVRRSFDFYVNNKSTLHENAAMLNKHTQGRIAAEEWWKELFGISWEHTRQKISRIATAFLMFNCKPDGMLFHSEFECLPKEGWIIPIDDDDLIDPKIIKILRQTDLKNEMVNWGVFRLGHGAIIRRRVGFPSNGYAISADKIVSNTEIVVQRHLQAAKVRRKNESIETLVTKCVPIDGMYGCKITNPASVGMLKSYKTRENCVAEIKKFQRSNVDGLPEVYRTHVRRIIDNCFTFAQSGSDTRLVS